MASGTPLSGVSQVVDVDGRCDGAVASVVGVEVVAGVVAGVELLRVGGVGDRGGEVGNGVVLAGAEDPVVDGLADRFGALEVGRRDS